MVLGYNNDDGAQALDQQQEIDFRRGWQVVNASGGSNLVTAGTGSYDVDVAAGDINTPTGTVTCSAATLDLQSLVDPDLPRIVLVYRDASGVAQTLAGTPAAKQPEGETSPGPIYQPAPDAFSTTDGVVLATVLLEAAASSVGSGQIRDRRMPASLNVDSAEVGSLNVDALENGVAGANNTVEKLATEHIETVSASGSTPIEFGPLSDYNRYILTVSDLVITNNGSNARIFLSTDGGTSFVSGGTEYSYTIQQVGSSGSTSTRGATGNGNFRVTDSGLSGTDPASFTCVFSRLNDAAQPVLIEGEGVYTAGNGEFIRSMVGGKFDAADEVDGIQFEVELGSAVASVYGVIE